MTAFDRRRFLQATATAAIVGAAATGAARPETEEGWHYREAAEAGSAFAHAVRTDDGYLFVGGAREEGYVTEGLGVSLRDDGSRAWSRRYLSAPQREARDRDVAAGQIPEDRLSFALEAGDGYLLVGWTYYDNTAVDVARTYRVDADGTVRETHDLGDLADASAYSHLADGVATDDGFLCCGIESPGIALGGAGWLVSLADDGSVTRHERYPATERNLERTTKRDVFNAIAATERGYVLAGACELERGEPAHGWVVGLDADGAVRWDDRFRLPGDEPTVVYDVEPSESDRYDVLIVGATGTDVRRRRAHDFEAQLGGDGFVAAYTDDGERRWLEPLADTPLFCTETTDRGVIAGGARDGRGWVGTVSRTAFHAESESVVASLCRSHRDGLVAAGRATDGGRTDAWARALEGIDGDDGGRSDESERDDEGSDDAGESEAEGDDPDERSKEEASVEFLDCHRVRVVGDYADVILSLAFEAEDGMLGTITEPVGGVDGERTIDGAVAFGLDAETTVIASVELFEDGGVATPGLGDRWVENPDFESCERERLGETRDRALDEKKGADGTSRNETAETGAKNATKASSEEVPKTNDETGESG